MPPWTTAFVFSALLVVFPYSMVLKLLFELPKPVALSHRRWPLWANYGIVAAVTMVSAYFIRAHYLEPMRSEAIAMPAFLVVAVAYAFGLHLLFRQFSGVYDDFVVTTGAAGLMPSKTAYSRIRNVEQKPCRSEVVFRLSTDDGRALELTLKPRDAHLLTERLRRGGA